MATNYLVRSANRRALTKEFDMLKLIAALAALTFVSACTTTGTLSSGTDARSMGAGSAASTSQGFGPSVAPLGSGPGANTIYLPG